MKKYIGLLVILIILAIVPATVAQDMVTLEAGVPAIGDLTGIAPVATFNLSGEAGDFITLTMFGIDNDIDPVIRLFDSADSLVMESVPSNLGALLGPVELPQDDDYTVVVSDANNSETGEFQLLLEDQAMEDLPLGEWVDGDLPLTGSVDVYTVDVEAESQVAYFTDGQALSIHITGPNGEYILGDGVYDGPGNLLLTLTESGTYTFVIGTAAEAGTDYSLVFRVLEIQPLVSGTPLSGTMTESNPAVFSFTSAAGKIWQLDAMLPAEGERNIEVLQTQPGWEFPAFMASDSGSGPDGNPRIDPFIAPEDGVYYVYLFFDNYDLEEDEVEYTMTLNSSSLVSLAPGSPITGTVSSETGSVVYAYNGTAGQTVRITLTQTGGEGAPWLAMLSADDEVFFFGGRSARAITVDVVLPVDGLYRVEVEDISYESETNVEFSLLLETLD